MAAMAVIGFFYLSSGLVAPLWAVIGLITSGSVLVVIGISWFRHGTRCGYWCFRWSRS